jgi:hypothetical protein
MTENPNTVKDAILVANSVEGQLRANLRDNQSASLRQTTAADEPYYIGRQEPPTPECALWLTAIIGPFISVNHYGTTQRCGPDTVKLLNLAYTAGRRNSR